MTVESIPLDLATAVVDGLNPARPTFVRRRQGVIAAVNAGPPPTVNVTIGGLVVPGLRYLAGSAVAVGAVVFVDFNGSDPLVIGPISDGNDRVGCSLRRVANQTINHAAETSIIWDTEDSDPQGFIAVPSATVTVPAGWGGVYAMTCNYVYSGFPSSGRLFVNFSTAGRTHRFVGRSEDRCVGSITIPMAAGATVAVNAYHENGGAALLLTSHFDMYRVSR